jgi:hypothetical protein
MNPIAAGYRRHSDCGRAMTRRSMMIVIKRVPSSPEVHRDNRETEGGCFLPFWARSCHPLGRLDVREA